MKTNEKYKVSHPIVMIRKHKTDSGPYWIGSVITPVGIVEVYAQSSERNGGSFTTLRVVKSGYAHERRYPRTHTERGLAIIAHRFAREIAFSA